MKKEELTPGSSVCMEHAPSIEYTYLGEMDEAKTASTHQPIHGIAKEEYGVFGYNPLPDRAFKTVLLPFSALKLVKQAK